MQFYKTGNYGGGIENYAAALISRLEKVRQFSMEQ
jgi:hypothetical protein